MKIKVHCIGLLQAIDAPFAVVVADIQIQRDPIKRRYVLLPETYRAQVSRMTSYSRDYNRATTIDWPSELPALIRTHAFRIAHARDGFLASPLRPLGVFTGGEPILRYKGTWGNAETLWVSTDVGLAIIGDFNAWRNENPALPNERIWAPSWGALTAVQALALAAGTSVPNEEELAHG